ncbi:esterase OVCA2-like isoform X2 [Ornithodoros turicata]|uniref:esterase OVCA2-like isoform X2 n=1 Tax=Ornithodoros turicata TaxID=34597 RepID=UPI0031386198
MGANEAQQVLCLHGYGQNAKVFASKIGAFRKATKSLLDLEFIDAPNVLPPRCENGIQEGDRCAWWYSMSDDTVTCLELSHKSIVFERSINAIREAWISHGPFDGILGFSQGATMVTFVLFLQALGKIQSNFRFAVMIAGGESRSLYWDVVCEPSLVTIPTLHIIGENDSIVPKEVSCGALQHFSSPSVLFHPGGHYIPGSGPCKLEYRNFFKEQLRQKHHS